MTTEATAPAETKDLLAEASERADVLRARGDEILGLKPPWGETPKREIEEFELNQLRALGYKIP